MPLPTSGALTLANIAAEFGGALPHNLTEYYAGGAYVPAGTEGSGGAIPASGAISLQDFYGAPVTPAVQNPITFSINPAYAGYDDTIFDRRAYIHGWATVWKSGGSAYGSIRTGNPASNEGWSIASVSYLQEDDAVVPMDGGYLINFGSTAWQGNFKFEITDTEATTVLYTASADYDIDVTVSYSGGTKQVRQCWWQFSTNTDNAPRWGYPVTIKVTRL